MSQSMHDSSSYTMVPAERHLAESKQSEVMILGTPAQLRSTGTVSVVDVAGTTLPVSPHLKSIGVIIDSHTRFDNHVGCPTVHCIQYKIAVTMHSYVDLRSSCTWMKSYNTK